MARPRRAHCARPDGTGGNRGQRRASECPDQQRIRGKSRQRAGELAQYRVSVDAIAARDFRRRHRHGHTAARLEERGNWQHR